MGQLDTMKTQIGDDNPVATGAIENEQRALLGNTAGEMPTIAEDALMSPFNNVGPTGPSGDVVRFASDIAGMNSLFEELGKGDSLLRHNPDGSWEAVPLAQVMQDTAGHYVVVPGQDNATIIEGTSDNPLEVGYKATRMPVAYGVVYETKPITVAAPGVAQDLNTGRFPSEGMLPSGPVGHTDNNIGEIAYLPGPNGQEVPVYGIYTNGGEIRWTTENPFIASKVVRQQRGVDGLTVFANVNPDDPNSLYQTERDAEQKVIGEFYSPGGTVDQSLFGRYSSVSFIDPGLAYQASTPTGRSHLASLSPEVVAAQFAKSPWIDWNDHDKVGEFWGDVASVRRAEATQRDPNNRFAGDLATLNFWNEITAQRGTQSPLWNDAAVRNTLSAATLGVNQALAGLPGVPANVADYLRQDKTADYLNQIKDTMYGKWALGPQGPGTAATRPPKQYVGLHGEAYAGPSSSGYIPSNPQAQPGAMPAVLETMGGKPGPQPMIKVPGAPQTNQPQPRNPYTSVKGSAYLGPPSIAPHPTTYGYSINPDTGLKIPLPPPPPPPPGMPTPGCFVAGTMVNTPSGPKAIETMREGDAIMAWDEKTRQIVASVVEKTLPHPQHTEPRLKITLDTGTQIEVTESHRFYDSGFGDFRPIKDFEIGDTLYTGLPVFIKNIERMGRTPTDVFNLEVAEQHTYLVHGVVVHNAKSSTPGY
jgi:hypothetical protein